jgi:two-component sensor histidine kinase
MSTTHPFNPPMDAGSWESLLREERHRAKNTLQVIASLLSLQSRESGEGPLRTELTAAQDRVRVIALLYDRLSRTGAGGRLDFAEALREIVALAVRSQASPVVTSHVLAESLLLSLESAIPLGLIAYELLTDSVQNAFVGQAAGRLEVSLRPVAPPAEYTLVVSDDGATRSPLALNTGEGLRGKIVDVLIRQLRARLTLESVSGTRLAVRFSMPTFP